MVTMVLFQRGWFNTSAGLLMSSFAEMKNDADSFKGKLCGNGPSNFSATWGESLPLMHSTLPPPPCRVPLQPEPKELETIAVGVQRRRHAAWDGGGSEVTCTCTAAHLRGNLAIWLTYPMHKSLKS